MYYMFLLCVYIMWIWILLISYVNRAVNVVYGWITEQPLWLLGNDNLPFCCRESASGCRGECGTYEQQLQYFYR